MYLGYFDRFLPAKAGPTWVCISLVRVRLLVASWIHVMVEKRAVVGGRFSPEAMKYVFRLFQSSSPG